jgi:hypothetical protein
METIDHRSKFPDAAVVLSTALYTAGKIRRMAMLRSIEGIYRNGGIELSEVPADVDDETRVIVMFLPKGSIELRELGIDAEQAAELHARLASFAEEWNSPEMSVYDAVTPATLSCNR